ncbi:hypothetical protein RLIN73S_07309 [Rhodanobacter lindaniclasticus]
MGAVGRLQQRTGVGLVGFSADIECHPGIVRRGKQLRGRDGRVPAKWRRLRGQHQREVGVAAQRWGHQGQHGVPQAAVRITRLGVHLQGDRPPVEGGRNGCVPGDVAFLEHLAEGDRDVVLGLCGLADDLVGHCRCGVCLHRTEQQQGAGACCQRPSDRVWMSVGTACPSWWPGRAHEESRCFRGVWVGEPFHSCPACMGQRLRGRRSMAWRRAGGLASCRSGDVAAPPIPGSVKEPYTSAFAPIVKLIPAPPFAAGFPMKSVINRTFGGAPPACAGKGAAAMLPIFRGRRIGPAGRSRHRCRWNSRDGRKE